MLWGSNWIQLLCGTFRLVLVISLTLRFNWLRPIPNRPICSPPTTIVSRLESANWIGVEILNMFKTGSRPAITKSVVESGIELADSTDDSAANHLKIGLWVRAFRPLFIVSDTI